MTRQELSDAIDRVKTLPLSQRAAELERLRPFVCESTRVARRNRNILVALVCVLTWLAIWLTRR